MARSTCAPNAPPYESHLKSSAQKQGGCVPSGRPIHIQQSRGQASLVLKHKKKRSSTNDARARAKNQSAARTIDGVAGRPTSEEAAAPQTDQRPLPFIEDRHALSNLVLINQKATDAWPRNEVRGHPAGRSILCARSLKHCYHDPREPRDGIDHTSYVTREGAWAKPSRNHAQTKGLARKTHQARTQTEHAPPPQGPAWEPPLTT